jgi:hypothetical protein
MERINFIANRNFGSRALRLASDGLVWVCESPANRVTPDQAQSAASAESRITTYRVDKKETAESMLVRMLPTIVASHPHWSEFRGFGVQLTAEVRSALKGAGALDLTELPDGLHAMRH